MSFNFNHTARIEERLEECKGSIKTYATYERAVAKADELSDAMLTYYEAEHRPMYTIVYLPSTERWTPVIDLTSFLRGNHAGGYIGFLSDKGFYTV